MSDDEGYDGFDGFAFLRNDVVCYNQEKPAIPKSWIFLGSQSTLDACDILPDGLRE